MPSNLATLRSHVELSLAGRIVSPFGYRDRKSVETVLTGIPEIDSLAGGLPRGALTEICGPPCSGRTTVLLSALASRTSEAEVCALIDARDSFDPRSAEAAGVELRRLLWVRCRGLDQALRAADLLIQGGGFGFIALDLSDIAPETVRQVPLNTWFRFRRAVEDTATVLVVLEQESNAKTCASVVLQMRMESARWSATVGGGESFVQYQNPQTQLRRLGHPELLWHPVGGSVLAHACLLDSANIRAEMVHTRIQSINYPQACNGAVSIAVGRTGGQLPQRHRGNCAGHGQGGGMVQNFTAQSVWSYLRPSRLNLRCSKLSLHSKLRLK